MNNYIYRCPVCGFKAAKSRDICTHMCGIHDYPLKHVEWIESHGLSYPELLGFKDGKVVKGSYKPLMDLIERDYKTSEQ